MGICTAIYPRFIKTSAIYQLHFDILRIILYNMRNKEIQYIEVMFARMLSDDWRCENEKL